MEQKDFIHKLLIQLYMDKSVAQKHEKQPVKTSQIYQLITKPEKLLYPDYYSQ